MTVLVAASSALPQGDRHSRNILSINFARLRQKLSAKGWSNERIQAAEQSYLRFLYLLAKYPGEIIIPWSVDLDEFWHQHILDTKGYPRDCEAACARFIHHDPYIEERQEDYATAVSRTKELYLEEFWTPLEP